MKVQELIQLLSTEDPNAEIVSAIWTRESIADTYDIDISVSVWNQAVFLHEKGKTSDDELEVSEVLEYLNDSAM